MKMVLYGPVAAMKAMETADEEVAFSMQQETADPHPYAAGDWQGATGCLVHHAGQTKKD